MNEVMFKRDRERGLRDVYVVRLVLIDVKV